MKNENQNKNNKEEFKKTIVRLHGETVDLAIFRKDREAIELYTEWLNNEDYLHFIGRNQIIQTFADEKKWAEREEKDNEFRFNIITKLNKQMIGNCDIWAMPYSRSACLGILIANKEFQNKGIGTEVIKLLLKYCFEELNMHNVMLQLDSTNERAYRCYEKAGFKECGRERECNFHHGKYSDTITMQILEQDYFMYNED